MKHAYKQTIFLFTVFLLILCLKEAKAQRFKLIKPETVYVAEKIDTDADGVLDYPGYLDTVILVQVQKGLIPTFSVTSTNQTVVKDSEVTLTEEGFQSKGSYDEYRFRVTAEPEIYGETALTYIKMYTEVPTNPEMGVIERLLAVKFGGGLLPKYTRLDFGDLKPAEYNLMNDVNFKLGIKAPNPIFVDIDGDGDLDCFSGGAGDKHDGWGDAVYDDDGGRDQQKGIVYFLENIGDSKNPVFSDKVESPFNIVIPDKDRIKNYYYPALTFGDLDADGDKDLIIGFNSKKNSSFNEETGGVLYYENIGTKESPNFQYRNKNPFGLDVDTDGDGYSDFFPKYYDTKWMLTNHPSVQYRLGQTEVNIISPTLVDLNGNGLLDLFISTGQGTFHYFMNEGTSALPVYNKKNDFKSIPTASNRLNYRDGGIFGLPIRDEIQWDVSTNFLDIDEDGDPDLLIGDHNHGINYFENISGIGASMPEFDPNYQVLFPYHSPFTTNDPNLTASEKRAILRYQTLTVADLDGDGLNEIYTGRRARHDYEPDLGYGLFSSEPRVFSLDEAKQTTSFICSRDLTNTASLEQEVGTLSFKNFDPNRFDVVPTYRLIGETSAIKDVKILPVPSATTCDDGCAEFKVVFIIEESTKDLKVDTFVGIDIYVELVPKGVSSQVILNASSFEQSFDLTIGYCGPPIGTIKGKVFEDLKYGHEDLIGADLTLTATEVNVHNSPEPTRLLPIEDARVELYKRKGNDWEFIDFTRTDQDGAYIFGKKHPGEGGLSRSNYMVRVVNKTVKSPVRPETFYDVLGVLTYSEDFTKINKLGIIDKPGGLEPFKQDLPSNTKSSLKSELLSKYPDNEFSSTAQVSFTGDNLVINGADTTDLKEDLFFTFNFNTVVNANTLGQGSFEQVIQNINSLDRNYILNSTTYRLDHIEKTWFRIPEVANATEEIAYNFKNDNYTITAPLNGFTPLETTAELDASTQIDFLRNPSLKTNLDSLFSFNVLSLDSYDKIDNPKLRITLDGKDVGNDPRDATLSIEELADGSTVRGFSFRNTLVESGIGLKLNADSLLVEGNIFTDHETHIEVLGHENSKIGSKEHPNLFGGTTDLTGIAVEFKTKNGTLDFTDLPKRHTVQNNIFGEYLVAGANNFGEGYVTGIKVAGVDNLVSNNFFSAIRNGIHISKLGSDGSLESGIIRGNYIHNSDIGIQVDTLVQNYLIGGYYIPDQNVIIDALKAIAVGDEQSKSNLTNYISILPNYIQNVRTGGFSIDLENNDDGSKNPDGTLKRATPNDNDDVDSGANTLLNYAEIQDPVVLLGKGQASGNDPDTIQFDVEYHLPSGDYFRAFFYKNRTSVADTVPEIDAFLGVSHRTYRGVTGGSDKKNRKVPNPLAVKSDVACLYDTYLASTSTGAPSAVDETEYITAQMVKVKSAFRIEERTFAAKVHDPSISISPEEFREANKYYEFSSELSDMKTIQKLPDLVAEAFVRTSTSPNGESFNLEATISNQGKNINAPTRVSIFWKDPTASDQFTRLVSKTLAPLDTLAPSNITTLEFNNIKLPCQAEELFLVINDPNSDSRFDIGDAGGRITPNPLGQYYSLEESYANNKLSISITDTLPFDISAPSISDYCLGEEVEINLSGLVSNATYQLSFQSSTIEIQKPQNSDTTIKLNSFTNSGNFTVSLTGKSPAGCEETKSSSFIIHPKANEVVFGLDNSGNEIKDYELCSGEDFRFILENFDVNTNYYISDYKGNSIGSNSVFRGNGATRHQLLISYADLIENSFDHRFASDGVSGVDTFKIKVQAYPIENGSENTNCLVEDEINLKVYNHIKPLTLSDVSVCNDSNLEIPIEILNPQEGIYYWVKEKTIGNNLMLQNDWATTKNPSPSLLMNIKVDEFNPRRIDLGNNPVALYAMDSLPLGRECRVELSSFGINIKPKPNPLAISDLTICQNDTEEDILLDDLNNLVLDYRYVLYEWDEVNNQRLIPAIDSVDINSIQVHTLKLKKANSIKGKYKIFAKDIFSPDCETEIAGFEVTELNNFNSDIAFRTDQFCEGISEAYVYIESPQAGITYEIVESVANDVDLNTQNYLSNGIDSLTFDLPSSFSVRENFVYIKANAGTGSCSYFYGPVKIELVAKPAKIEGLSPSIEVCQGNDGVLEIKNIPLDYSASKYKYTLKDNSGTIINQMSVQKIDRTLEYSFPFSTLDNIKNNSPIHVYVERADIKSSCEVEIGTVPVIINSLPSVRLPIITAACENEPTIINIDGVVAGLKYQVFNANNKVSPLVEGECSGICTDLELSLSVANRGTDTDFVIKAIDQSTGCESIELPFQITTLAIPTRANLSLVTNDLCEGSSASILIENIESLVLYSIKEELVNGNLRDVVILGTNDIVNGTQTDRSLSFNPIGLGNHTYKVFAGLSSCEIELSNTVSINVTEPPILEFDLVEQCENSTDDSFINLKSGIFNADYSYEANGIALDISEEQFNVGVLTTPTTFKVSATKISGACVVEKDVSLNPYLKPVFTATQENLSCVDTETSIRIENASSGDTLKLYKNNVYQTLAIADRSGKARMIVAGSLMSTSTVGLEIRSISKNSCLGDPVPITLQTLSIPSMNANLIGGNACEDGIAYIKITNFDKSASYAIYDGSGKVAGFKTSTQDELELSFDLAGKGYTSGVNTVQVKVGHPQDAACIFDLGTADITVLEKPKQINTSLVEFCEAEASVVVNLSSVEKDIEYSAMNQNKTNVLFDPNNILLSRTSVSNSDSWDWEIQENDLNQGLNYIPVRIKRTETDLASVCEVYDSLEVTLNLLPIMDVLNIQNPTVCLGDDAIVEIKNPESNVAYELVNTSIGFSKAFTNDKITLTSTELAQSKTYRVIGRNTNSNCETERTSPVVITVIDQIETDKTITIPYFCEADLENNLIKTKLTIPNAQSSVVYKVYDKNNNEIASETATQPLLEIDIELNQNDYPFDLTGIAKTYELLVTASTSSSPSTCTYDLDDKAELILVSTPVLETLIGETVCLGNPTSVKVKASDNANKNYNLYDALGALLSNPGTQSGSDYDFPISASSIAGNVEYGVKTTWKNYSCTSPIGSVNVSHEALPTSKTVDFVPACESESGDVIAYLTSPEDVKYSLSNSLSSILGVETSTDRVEFSIPRAILTDNIFDLVVVNNTPQLCSQTFTGALNVVLTPNPQNKSVIIDTDLDSICIGGNSILQVLNSQPNVNYEVFTTQNGVEKATGASEFGNGGLLTIDIPLEETEYAAGVYNFIVKAGNSNCEIELNEKPKLTILGKPITPILDYAPVCENEFTNVSITNAESYVNYQLFSSDANEILGALVGSADVSSTVMSVQTSTKPEEFFLLKTYRTDIPNCAISDEHFSIPVKSRPLLDPPEPSELCRDNDGTILINNPLPQNTYAAKDLISGTQLQSRMDGNTLIFDIPSNMLGGQTREFLISAESDEGCESNLPVTVNTKPLPPTPLVDILESCNSTLNIRVSNLTVNYTYQFYDEQNSVAASSGEITQGINSVDLEILNAIEAHNYTLKYSLDLLNDNSCTFNGDVITADLEQINPVNVDDYRVCKDEDVLVQLTSNLQPQITYYLRLKGGYNLPMANTGLKQWLIPADSLEDGFNQLKIVGESSSGFMCSAEVGEVTVEVLNLDADVNDDDSCLGDVLELPIINPVANAEYILKLNGVEVARGEDKLTVPTDVSGSFVYDLYAIHNTISCEQNLNKSVSVEVYEQIDQTLTIVNPTPSVCYNSPSLTITINNATVGMEYWVVNLAGNRKSQKIKQLNPGNLDLTFDLPVNTEGDLQFYVMAGREGTSCEQRLDDEIQFRIEAELRPVIIDFSPNQFCEEASNVSALLTNTSKEISYSFFIENNLIETQSATVDNQVLSFLLDESLLKSPSLTYRVERSNATGCVETQSEVQLVKGIPLSVEIKDTVFCYGTNGNVMLEGVTDGVSYTIEHPISGEVAHGVGTSQSSLSIEIDKSFLNSDSSIDSFTDLKLISKLDGCERIQDFSIKVLSEPNKNLTLENVASCEKSVDSYQIKILNADQNVKYKVLDLSGRELSGDYQHVDPLSGALTLSNPGNLFENSGKKEIIIYMQTEGSCEYLANNVHEIQVHPIPNLTLGALLEACAGSPGVDVPVFDPQENTFYSVLQNQEILVDKVVPNSQDIIASLLNLYVRDDNNEFILPENVKFNINAENIFGCQNADLLNLRVKQLPSNDFSVSPALGCIGESTTLGIYGLESGDKVQLIQSDVILSEAVAESSNVNLQAPITGLLNDFKLRRISADDCSTSSDKPIQVIGVEKPSNTFEPQNLEICDSDVATFEIKNVEEGITYQVLGGRGDITQLLGKVTASENAESLTFDLNKVVLDEVFDQTNNTIDAQVYAKRGEAACFVTKEVTIKKARSPEKREVTFEAFECDPFIRFTITQPQANVRYQIFEKDSTDALKSFMLLKDKNKHSLGIEIKREWRDATFVNFRVSAYYAGDSKACPTIINEDSKVLIIEDKVAPVFVTTTFPLSVDRFVEGNEVGALINWELPIAEDCNLDSVWSETIEPNTFVKLGYHKIPIKAVDLAGNLTVDTLRIYLHKGYPGKGQPPVAKDTSIYVKKAEQIDINVLSSARGVSSELDSTLVFFSKDKSSEELTGNVRRKLDTDWKPMFTLFEYTAPDEITVSKEYFKFYILDKAQRKSNEAIVTIRLIDDVFIPKFFTPNNDGINDAFIIEGIQDYPNNSIKIYNRWGIKVFDKKKYKNDWVGENTEELTVGGTELPQGTYFYLFDKGDGSDIIKGYVYIKKQ